MRHSPIDPGQLSPSDFEALAGILHRETGIYMPESKRTLMQSRLSKRLRALGLPDFGAYRHRVEREAPDGELNEMISCLTTNVTRFFRESQHFDDLAENLLPKLLETARAGRRVRFWSAGCSTGEEPYSLALLLLDLCPDAPTLDIRILASDIDPKVLEVGIAGRYPPSALDQLPARLRRFFRQDPDEPALQEICDAARRLVRFRQLNLLHEWPISGQFDAIFCRNVVIYFDLPTQERLWKRFADKLLPEGRLYIGHSERLFGASLNAFKTSGAAGYVRVSTPVRSGADGPAAPQETAR